MLAGMAAEQHRKVALVTGGAKRVGRAIVERLADAGYDVVFTYHTSEDAAKELSARPGVRGIEADLTKSSGAAHVAFTFSLFSDHLDVLVNNASLYEAGKLDQTTVEHCRRLMAIHFETPLLLAQTFAGMLRGSRGHVVNMVDLLAERPRPQYLAYCASKAALANLTLGLARELAPEVTVNGIAPGVVEWPEDYPEAEREMYLKRVPLGRPGTPRDVADLVLYLCTAGSYLTGQILRLDGGRSIT